MKRKKKLVAAVLSFCLLATGTLGLGITARADTCGGLEPEDVYTPGEDEVIKDPILHWAIRAAMNSIKGGVKLTKEVVGDKSVKNISYELCSHPEDFAHWDKQYWIEDLEGIQYAKSATMVDICYTSAVEGKSLKDLSPLSELTQLDTLLLKQDGITDISALKTLVNLTQLDVSMNGAIRDISAVKDMTKLQSLNVASNQIGNMDAVAGLKNLGYLDVSHNNIIEFPDMNKLTNLKTLLATHNNFSDVSALAGLKNLEALDLSGNTGIKDVKALAGLTKLDKTRTYLPDESMKEDLFAVIEVNKLFATFNISTMTENDLENVTKALDAYDALTNEQKTYLDNKRVEAARSNKEKVENGEAPDYYPEYDEGGEKVPVFDRIEIQVVNKDGSPAANVEFVKRQENFASDVPADTTHVTDEKGKLVLKHITTDTWFDQISVFPKDDIYVAVPEKITYTVNNLRTETVNGKQATGLEELEIVLYKEGEYVDKSALQETLKEAEKVEEAFRYTEASYAAFEKAWNDAKKANENADATKAEVENAVSELNKAIENLRKADVLTELKLIVKDENGNPFTRPFKFQVRVPGTGAEAWNQTSDGENGAVYLKASPGWSDGKEWEIVACYEEPYDIDSIFVTIGKKDGQTYYKTVDGKAVDADFEKEVTVKARPDGAPDKENERKPDSTVLKNWVEKAKNYSKDNYTAASFGKLTEAVQAAEKLLEKSGASQEEYNQAVAELRKGIADLKEPANKVELKKLISMEYSYNQDSYTKDSWDVYAAALKTAKTVYQDPDALQETVDQTVKELKAAQNQLVLKADKTKLEEKLDEISQLKEEDYESGWDALQEAVADAESIMDKDAATQTEVNEALTKLQEAQENLVPKKEEVDYSCYPSVFRAKVMDENGNAIKGVKFQAVIGGEVDEEMPMVSDGNGIIEYYTGGPINGGKTTYIRLADDAYTTEDEHYFTMTGTGWTATMKTIDGKPYQDGTKLTYVLKENGGTTPEPGEKVLTDETTFRAKVVDENGKPLSGMEFLVDGGFEDCKYSVTSNDKGIIEYKVASYDFDLEFTVSLKSQGHETTPEKATFVTGTPAEIVSVNGKMLPTEEEIIFTVIGSEEPDPEPEVNKEDLKAAIEKAKDVENKNYTDESWAAFQNAIKAADSVFNNDKATQDEVNAQIEALEKAEQALTEKEPEPEPEPEPGEEVLSDKMTFRALVQNENGEPLSGIEFLIDGGQFYRYTETTNKNGVLEYPLKSEDQGFTFTVKPVDEQYEVEPGQATFVTGMPAEILTINGKPLSDQEAIIFVIQTGEEPEPEPEPEVNKDDLEAAIEKAKAVENKNYTEKSWNAFQQAIKAAEDVLNNDKATQDEVNTQISALDAAEKALAEPEAEPEVNKEDLRIVIEKAKAVENKNYTDESWATFQNAIKAAESVFNNENATQDEVNAQIAALEAAEKALIEKEPEPEPSDKVLTDETTFRATVVDENGKPLSGMTFLVDGGFEDCRYEVMSNNQGVVEYKVAGYDFDLEFIVSLKSQEHEMTPDKAIFVTDANAKIVSVNGKGLPVEEEIVFAVKTAEEPEPEVIKDGLETAIKGAQAVENKNYTEESWSAFQQAIEAAKDVLNNDKATQEEVNAQIAALEKAEHALIEKEPEPEPEPEINKESLKAAIEKAEAVENKNYTEESWNALQNVIKVAKVVLEDKDAAQTRVDEQVKALEDAIKALKAKTEPEKPEPEKPGTSDPKPNPDKQDSNKPDGSSGNAGGNNKPADGNVTPKTGDTAQPFVYMVGMLAAVGVCAIVFRRKRVK